MDREQVAENHHGGQRDHYAGGNSCGRQSTIPGYRSFSSDWQPRPAASGSSRSSTGLYAGHRLVSRQAVGAATGIAGALGSFATIVFAETTGRVLQHDPKAYLPMFVACGLMYMVALAMIHLLAPRLQPITLD